MLFGTLAILMGYQLIQFAVFSKTFAIEHGLMPSDKSLVRFSKVFTLERSLILGSLTFVGGMALLGIAVNQWRHAGCHSRYHVCCDRLPNHHCQLLHGSFKTCATRRELKLSRNTPYGRFLIPSTSLTLDNLLSGNRNCITDNSRARHSRPLRHRRIRLFAWRGHVSFWTNYQSDTPNVASF